MICDEWMNHDGWMACDEWMTCDEWRSCYEWTNYDEWITRHKWKTCEWHVMWHVMSQEASPHDASCTCSSLQAALVQAYHERTCTVYPRTSIQKLVH